MSPTSLLRLRRLARRAGTEIAVALFAAVAAIQLLSLGEPVLAAGTLAAGSLTTVAALSFLLHRGELQLAWRCPRLDALGVSIASVDAPWPLLLEADGALEALEEASVRFPAFFPDGHLDLLRGANRALDMHRARARALAEASRLPDGLPRRSLRSKASRAEGELKSLERGLGEIRARLHETCSAPPCPEGEAALAALSQRTAALAAAVAEVGASPSHASDPAAVLHPLPLGERA